MRPVDTTKFWWNFWFHAGCANFPKWVSELDRALRLAIARGRPLMRFLLVHGAPGAATAQKAPRQQPQSGDADDQATVSVALVRRCIARLAEAVCDHRFAAGVAAPEIADDAIGHKDAAFRRSHQVKAHRTTRHLARLRPIRAAHSHFLSRHDDRLPRARTMLTESHPQRLHVARVRQLSSLPALSTGYPQDFKRG